MAVYTVHEPPRRTGDERARSERFRFVRDGFAWGGFLFGPLWMLRHRLWLALVLYGVLVAALFLTLSRIGAGTAATIVFLIALLLGYEGSSLRRSKLVRTGYGDAGVVIATDREAAERRFFDAFVAAPKMVPPPLAAAARSDWPASAAATGIIGSFPEPGARS